MSSFIGNISHREPRHASFLAFEDCNYIHHLNSLQKCNFVKTTESCRENVFYFDYTYFLFCTIGEENVWQFNAGVALLMSALLVLFTVLATTADQFFCPVLAVIAKTLRISESVAGVTILAFGNGSPDLFTAINNPQSDTELMFGELLGAGMFVIGVVAGIILLIRPFQLYSAAIVRDVIFFIFAVAWISGCAFDQRFELSDAIVVVVIYVLYLIVVVIDFFVLRQRFQEAESQVSLSGEVPDSDSYYNELRGEAKMIIRSPSVGSELDISKTRISVFQNVHQRRPPRNHYLFLDFLEHIIPVDRDEWNDSAWLSRILSILKAPVMFALLLTIPIMDYTAVRHGWTKLLNILHWLTLPMLTLGVSGSFFDSIFSCPAWAYLLICSSTIMIVIFCTSRTDRPPRYHIVYALLAFVGSIQVIYVVAQEVVCLLVTLGLVLKLSKSMLGLSVLAWGNSIGDLFSNITLAKRGYAKMAFAACLGGPLFNLCLGLGITMILKASAAEDHVAFSREGAMGENCEWFLIQLLYTLLFVLLLSDFQGRQSTGVIMITIYVIFFLFCLLGELEVIHPFGTDHFHEYV